MEVQVSITARLIQWLFAICDKCSPACAVFPPQLQFMSWLFPLLLIRGLKHQKITLYSLKRVGFSAVVEFSWHALILHMRGVGMKPWEHRGEKESISWPLSQCVSNVTQTHMGTCALLFFFHFFIICLFCRYPSAPAHPFEGCLDLGNRDPRQCGVSGARLPSRGPGE